MSTLLGTQMKTEFNVINVFLCFLFFQFGKVRFYVRVCLKKLFNFFAAHNILLL